MVVFWIDCIKYNTYNCFNLFICILFERKGGRQREQETKGKIETHFSTKHPQKPALDQTKPRNLKFPIDIPCR